MIVINGKTYRNLEEQVKKNMDDITELQNKSSSDVTKEYVDTQDQALQGQITVLETSKQNTLSQAQLNATNSGITANKVSKYDGYENTKQGKLTAGNNITISADNVISATGGGGGISPSEANTFTGKQTFSGGIVSTKPATADNELITLAQMKNSNLGNQNYTDTKFTELNNQLVATNTEVANKLNKATSTSGSYAYVRNGNRDETIPVNSLVGTDAIVRRTSTGTIKANAGVDENDCVNKKQLDDAIAGVSGSEVTKAYVDNGLAGKLDKLENTSDRTECYVNQAGTNRLLNTSTDATRNLIVRWDNGAKLHSNTATAGDEVVNYNQWTSQNNDLKANIDLKADLTANTFTGVQTISNEMEGALVFNKTSVSPFTELFKLTYTTNETPITETFRIPMTTENAAHYLITSKTVNNGAGLNYDRNANSLTVGHKVTFASGMSIIYVTAKGVVDTLTTTQSTSIKDIVAMKVTATAGLNMTGCALDVANTKLLINESTLEQMTNKELIPLTDIIYQ